MFAAALLGVTGAAPAIKPANYDAFGIAMLQRLAARAPNQNVFISPVSIGVALSMAADGARGSTRQAIVHVLGISDNLASANNALIRAFAQNPDAQVGIANALWFRQDIPPRSPYVRLLTGQYRAQAQALHFGDPSAASAINAWTKAHTLGLIDRIVSQTYRSDFAYLTNALAFKADWTLPFKKSNTRPREFTDATGTKSNVPMMEQTAVFETCDAPAFRALRLPYGRGGYAAYIVLPTGSNANQLLKQGTISGFDRVLRALKPERLEVQMPKFTATYDTSLVTVLKALGMGIAFTDRADFTTMHSRPPSLVISDVHHATYVRVDEKGTTAAAATSVEIGMTAVQLPPKRFIVDHPFLLALRDEHTGTLLFIGVINKVA